MTCTVSPHAASARALTAAPTAPSRRQEDVFATIPLYGADVNAHSKTVGECDEAELIELIRSIVPDVPALVGNGDDATVLATNAPVVASSDMLVENRHFKLTWSTGADIGWRAAMQNFADIAAMGASGTALIVALGMPSATPLTWLADLASGLSEACREASYQWHRPVGIAGGDLTAASEIVISVTALGELTATRPVVRSGARVGDVVALCGTSGHSAAGLELAGPPPSDAPEQVRTCWHTYLRPAPPLAASADLARASAAMDVSDGLIRDAARIARASGVSLDLDQLTCDAVLLATARYLAASAPAGLQASQLARHWQLTGGEDHALLATFPPGQLPAAFTAIGQVRAKGSVPVYVDGAPAPASGGFDHFRLAP